MVSVSYACWQIGEAERQRLLALFPPSYPDVVAHHITYHYGSDELPLPAHMEIVGHTDNGHGVEALVVAVYNLDQHGEVISGGGHTRRDGGTYHVTWSIDRDAGCRSAHSNRAIADMGFTALASPIPFLAEPAVLSSR